LDFFYQVVFELTKFRSGEGRTKKDFDFFWSETKRKRENFFFSKLSGKKLKNLDQ